VSVRTRFAPSPTGDLHLGGAWTALSSWVVARRGRGKCVLRIEDLDGARVVAGAQARIEEDLRWLGLDWDDGPYLQSERTEAYERAIARLAAAGLVYPCDCSRTEIERIASAPHPGEERIYPGRCRDLDPLRPMRRRPALRVRVPDASVAYEDGIVGPFSQNLAREVGDFVLRRSDGVFAYQLACIVDDLAMGITDVVRGDDLALSTPRQVWLAGSLGASPPRYAHVPLVIARDGGRLEKRNRTVTLRELRQAGVSPERVLGELAFGLGLALTPVPTTASAIADTHRGSGAIPWRREAWPSPEFET
jgi:glutamyl-tRNA synthetase